MDIPIIKSMKNKAIVICMLFLAASAYALSQEPRPANPFFPEGGNHPLHPDRSR